MVFINRIIVAVVLLFTSLSYAAESTPVKIRAGFASIAAGHALIWVTKESGIFQKNGLDADLVYLQNPSLCAQALIGGSISFAMMGGSPVFEADVNGADLVLIITSKKTPSLVYLVTSRKIRNLDQLKGATFGVSRIGSTPDMILRWTLRQLGINPERDVKILQVGNSPLRMTALEAGRIDGTILTVDDKVTADKLNLNTLLDLRKLGIEWLEADIVTSRQVISRSEDTVRKFVKSMVMGIHYFKTHKAESMKVMAKYMTNADPKVIEAGYDFHAKEYLEKPYPSIKAMQAALEETARRNASVKGTRLEQFYEAKFVRELDESGFIDGLYH